MMALWSVMDLLAIVTNVPTLGGIIDVRNATGSIGRERKKGLCLINPAGFNAKEAFPTVEKEGGHT
jgi:hypothetical protein